MIPGSVFERMSNAFDAMEERHRRETQELLDEWQAAVDACNHEWIQNGAFERNGEYCPKCGDTRSAKPQKRIGFWQRMVTKNLH